MTPESLRRLADLLESDSTLEVRGVRIDLGVVTERRAPLTHAERQKRYRERHEKSQNVTESDAAVTPIVTGDLQGDPDPDLFSGREKAADPDGSKQAKSLQVSGERAESGAESDVTLDEQSHAVQPPGRTSKRQRRAGLWHFCPESWPGPTARHRTLALGLLLDVDKQAAAFRAHEYHVPKSDPDRAFEGWLRKANEMKTRSRGATFSPTEYARSRLGKAAE